MIWARLENIVKFWVILIFSGDIWIALENLIEDNYDHQKICDELRAVHAGAISYPDYKNALLDLLRKHNIPLNRQPKKRRLRAWDREYAQITGGEILYGFHPYKKNSCDFIWGSAKYFSNEISLLSHMLSQHPGDYGIIIGDYNIADFIKNNGDAEFKTLPARQTRGRSHGVNCW